jgi:hypothetical protein
VKALSQHNAGKFNEVVELENCFSCGQKLVANFIAEEL